MVRVNLVLHAMHNMEIMRTTFHATKQYECPCFIHHCLNPNQSFAHRRVAYRQVSLLSLHRMAWEKRDPACLLFGEG